VRSEQGSAVTPSVTLSAPAKLTLSLRVTGRRPDGYHVLDVEMVTVDLVDTLTFGTGEGLTVVDDIVGSTGAAGISSGPDNLVVRALTLVGRQASVRLVKRIPAGAGLGGGSADAAAVLRWAGSSDPDLALALGSDVPFCLRGGRARVTGVGEKVEALSFEHRRFVLLLPPIAVSTAAVYRAWDEGDGAGPDDARVGEGGNHLEEAALRVAPRLGAWRDLFADVSGRRPRLAGSGSTWFVEGDPAELGLVDREFLDLDGERAALWAVGTLPPVSAPCDG
jgi:4-diphosphocytidyl-2-C-methyl-D-erythritol kinase